MQGHAEQCVQRYLDLARVPEATLKKVPTPCIDDHQIEPKDFETKGQLHENAAKVVLNILYLARMNRPDLLWAVNSLAREVTRWNVACDRRLFRLISYLHDTKHYTQSAFVGDQPTNLRIFLFYRRIICWRSEGF